jgi:hypothetical protein
MQTKFFLLSLAASALAAPAHKKACRSVQPTGSGVPYPMGNSTGIWGTGTAGGSGFPYPPSPTGKACSLKSRVKPTTTSTATVYQTSLVTDVVTVTGVHAAGVSSPAQEGGACASRSTVTVKTTEKVTVTVTPSATDNSPAGTSSAGGYFAESPSSALSFSLLSSVGVEEVSTYAPAPTPSSSKHGHHHHQSSSAAAAASTPVYTPAPVPSSSAAAPAASSEAPVASSEAPAPSSYVTPSPVSSQAPAPVSSSSPAETSASSGGSYGPGKRGLAFNDASLTNCFEGSPKVSWAYNWGSSTSGLSNSFEYVPMLWSTRSDFVSAWNDNANKAIANGATHLFSFNEPDLPAQANMSPGSAASGFMQYMEPFKSKGVKLGAPAVTNGGNGMGLDWMSSFLSACSECSIDFVNIHWYDSATNIDYFKSHVTEAHTKSGKPVWVTEFGATGSDDQVDAFLKEVMTWMDEQPFVERYAYFMVSDGKLVSGTDKSTIGTTYATA